MGLGMSRALRNLMQESHAVYVLIRVSLLLSKNAVTAQPYHPMGWASQNVEAFIPRQHVSVCDVPHLLTLTINHARIS